jgi:adenylate cyclase class 1
MTEALGDPDSSSAPRPMDHAQIARVTERFLTLRDTRLARLRQMLPERRREVIDLLPLLFHLNHPHLPAFVGSDVPAGLPGYDPGRDTQHAARKHLHDQSLTSAARYSFVLRGLYLMGSSGTLGQDRASDFDIWLIHDDALPADALGRLQAKARAVEAWAKSYDVEAHIFLMRASGFRDGEKDALSNESSGQTQHFLLLEEFYRTGVLLAGRPPLWWLVPPRREADYDAHLDYLAHNLGIRLEEWIDFGPLNDVPADEFFSSAHWQLHKGIDAPYKSILKLMLIEAYAAQYPQIQWLADRLKRAVYDERELDPNQLDPYHMLLERLTAHLIGRQEPDRLELARRSLYIKSGLKLSQASPQDDWRSEQLREISTQWGWDERHWQLLDNRPHWKLERVTEERDALVAELTRSYHLLTEFARARGSNMSRNGRELSLLGRRLYAALERRPGKVDLINPGISQDLSEEQLWICRHASGTHGGHWRLYREPPGVLGVEATPLKAASSLLEMLAWLYINGLASAGSHVQLLPRPLDTGIPEHRRILQVIEKHLGIPSTAPVPISAFGDNPQVEHSLAFLNVAPLPRLELQVPIDVDPTPRQAVDSIDHLTITSWGEILVRSNEDGLPGVLDTLCQHLNMIRPGSPGAARLYAHSFSSGAADAVARRTTELSEAISDALCQLGDQLRYVFQLEASHYLVQRGEHGLDWQEVGDRNDLLALLQERQTTFRPVRLHPRGLSDTPLVRLYEENVAGIVQVFYRLTLDGVEMFCLDDCGGLFNEQYPNINEALFLSQQQRLFDSLANRRLLASTSRAGDMLADGARFYRLAQSPEGWTVRVMAPPASGTSQQLELLLVTSGDGLSDENFSLIMEQREFNGLQLGSRLYSEVASHVLARRKPGQDYPIRITGVLPAGLEEGANWTVNEMLHAKQRIERRLTNAMRDLDRTRSSRSL